MGAWQRFVNWRNARPDIDYWEELPEGAFSLAVVLWVVLGFSVSPVYFLLGIPFLLLSITWRPLLLPWIRETFGMEHSKPRRSKREQH